MPLGGSVVVVLLVVLDVVVADPDAVRSPVPDGVVGAGSGVPVHATSAIAASAAHAPPTNRIPCIRVRVGVRACGDLTARPGPKKQPPPDQAASNCQDRLDRPNQKPSTALVLARSPPAYAAPSAT